MKLSVIIPAYNVEKTLRRCVESVVSQRVEDMEVIIINDGSSDRTEKEANILAEEFGCVKLITQPNGGLSDARNSGINIAQGEYITFVDSDDYLKANTYTPLLAILNQHPEYNLLEYSFTQAKDEEEVSSTSLSEETFTNFRDYWLRGQAYRHTYAWNKIFRRNIFFNGERPLLRFRKGKVFEDMHFLCDLLHLNPTIATTPLNGYIYVSNPEGITWTAGGKELSQLLEAHLEASKSMNLSFMKKQTSGRLPLEEEEYYLTAMNVQISVSRQTGNKPLLPTARVAIHTSDFRTPTKLIKKIILNTMGISCLSYL